MDYGFNEEKTRDEKGFFEDLKRVALEVKKRDNFVVIFHHDADGSASGAIAIKALEREGKKVSSICLKQLYKENIPQIKALGENYLFVDFGSGQIDYLTEAFGENYFVLDHHQPVLIEGVMPKCKFQVNPLLFGINGGTEISGSGVTFFFALELNKNNFDLSVLGIVGALGDMQDFNFDYSLIGLNRKILNIGVENKLIEVKKDLRLYGRVSRPLVSFLTFSTNPLLPGLTANEDNVKSFLTQLEIPLKDPFTEKWLSYKDLTFEKQRELTSALLVLLLENNTPEWKINELIGEVYTFSKENPYSPLSDGKEYATMLNACSRNKHSEIALRVCMGDRNEGYSQAISLMDIHRENLRRGIEFIKQKGIDEKSSFYFFDAGKNIDESIVGVIAGMLYGSIISETKPIIALAHNEDGSIKASGRGTSELVRRGLNIGGALKEISQIVQGVEGGGHCLDPNTLVQKQDGTINKISEIKVNDYLLTQDKNNITNALCNKVFSKKKKKIVTFKTPNFQISSSLDHRFFKYENFGVVEVRAQNIEEKDFILGIKKIFFKGSEVELLNNPFVYIKEEGLLLLKKARLNTGLSRKKILLKLPSFYKKHTLADIEHFTSHRLKENLLLNLLDIYNISRNKYLKKFIEKKFECKTKNLNKEIAWLVGYIQGDGYIDKKRIECKEPSNKIISYFRGCISKNFNLKTQVIDIVTYKKLRVYSADLCRFFKVNFPETVLLSGNLRVPKKIMTAKNELVAYYIRGLFDADGGAFDRFVYLDMIDEQLLRTVQLLLLRFGICSNIRETKIKPNEKWVSKKRYRLDITDFDSLKLFNKYIGFTKKGDKDNKLKAILLKQSKKKRNSMLLSPFTYKQIKEFIIQNNIPKDIFDFRLISRAEPLKRMNYFTLNKYFLAPIIKNKNKLSPLVNNKINFIKTLLDGGLIFCEIKKKTISNNKVVLIDLSIPKTKNFMANGLIVHNSIAAGAKIPSEKLDEVLFLLEEKFKIQLGI